MEYGAIAVALVGFCLGLNFRFKFLLPFIAVLLILTVPLCIMRGYGAAGTILTVFAAQFIIQGAYFFGLLARWIWSNNSHRTRLV
ncbi:MAG: hypothetical protein K2W78_16475 [Xanthobacteraceae bacterium]|nr:hypothetical protein [Xanthobacteraceae bacterium]